ncbi:hypothetical protein J8273_3873 [Carpediemonas membranifera]|uniref:Uncharacterized protein n=1 Tax=Carpediemonas membranifera TaxID=201153 RepID=A0A8J6B7C2_9EUKA|nr:hypothetical protein J8273_3873 [Carpediemonas membranifera]|eukprot:KAG9394619.1 hypothetical protein J8273_3873 [Carpediemonas membranifera]
MGKNAVLLLLALITASLAVRTYTMDCQYSSDYRGEVHASMGANDVIGVIVTGDANPYTLVDISANFSEPLNAFIVPGAEYESFLHSTSTLHDLMGKATLTSLGRRVFTFSNNIDTFFKDETVVVVLNAPVTANVSMLVTMTSPVSTGWVLIVSTVIGMTVFFFVLYHAVVFAAVVIATAYAPVRTGPKSKWVALIRVLIPGASYNSYLGRPLAAVASLLTFGFCFGPLFALPIVLLRVHRYNGTHAGPSGPKPMLLAQRTNSAIDLDAIGTVNDGETHAPVHSPGLDSIGPVSRPWMPVWVDGTALDSESDDPSESGWMPGHAG